ncbi:unnamed protein product [Discula destructiva]
MKTTTIITSLLAANLAFGARWTQRRREAREARRASSLPRSASSGPGETSSTTLSLANTPTNNTHTAYSQNWAGAILVNSGFTSVTGTITVPTPTSANNGQESAGAAWVGIDGNTCTSAILQTGIDWYVQGSTISYDAWYEWYPDYAYNFPATFTIKAGDSLRMTVTATSTTSGTAVIENLTTGQRAAQTFTNVAYGSLCQTDAEWIVEDFQSCDVNGQNCGLVPFANFGAVTFSNSAATQAGRTVTPGTPDEGLMVVNMYQNNAVLTDCAVAGGTVGCTYK